MRRTFAGAAALVVALAVLPLAACNSASPDNTIGVNALTADPLAFTGEVAVEGVVIEADPATGSLVLIDVTEYETCGLTPCASAGMLSLHVPAGGEPTISGALYEGTLPSLEDVVVAVGEVRSGPGGVYFDVERLFSGSQSVMTKR